MTSLSKILRLLSKDLPTRMISVVVTPSIAESSATQACVNQSVAQEEIVAKESQLQALEIEIQKKQHDLFLINEQGRELLEKTQEAAHQLLEDARKEDQVIRQKAHEAGENEGFRIGEANAKAHYAELILQAEEVLVRAEKEHKRRVRESESVIISLALQVAKKVVASHIQTDGNVAARLLTDLLIEVDKAKRVEVRVSPSELDVALERREQFNRALQHNAELIIVSDAHLAIGDVVIVTEIGSVDCRLSTRFAEVERALLKCAQEWEESDHLDE